MHKKAALAAVPDQLNFMEKTQNINSAIGASIAYGHIFGNLIRIANYGFSIGSNYGWLKTTQFDNYAKCPGIAPLRSATLRITGLIKSLQIGSNPLRSSI
jgi:hypothetical protein